MRTTRVWVRFPGSRRSFSSVRSSHATRRGPMYRASTTKSSAYRTSRAFANWAGPSGLWNARSKSGRGAADPPFELLHQSRVVNGVEVARQVRVIHLAPAGLERRLHLVERLVRVPPRTEAEGAPLEVRPENRFETH